MRKARLLFLFALLMTAVTGVWADDWTDIIINGNMEGSDRQCFFVKENGLGSDNLYYARIQDGIGKEGSRAILVQSTGAETFAWDTQFFLRLPYELPAGTKYRLTFDYKASVACECDLQSQNEPAEYIIYYIDNAQGSPACSFKTAWDTYDSGELTVPADCDGSQTTQEGLDFKNNFQTISFNMAKNQIATQFIIDNIKVEILSSVASGLTKSPAPRVLPQYPVEINSMAIMGDFLGKGTEGNWNMENAWALTKDDNIWKLTKEFTAEAKTYEYKVFANDNMDDFTYPVEAKGQFVISEAGNYILNIFADPEGNTVSVKAVAPVNYTVKLKDGVTDADKWTIAPAEAATDGVYEGTKVTLTYSGRLKVKGVKAEKKGVDPAKAYLKWDDGQKKLVATEIPAGATTVTSSTTDVTWDAGTYVVEGEVAIGGRITLNGNVELIIKDDAKLTVNQIYGGDSKYNLSIFGQANQTGQLIVNSSGGHAIYLITTLNVHSCQVTATSSGSGSNGFSGITTINVYGGSVDAESTGEYGNGIKLPSQGSMNIYGGEVKVVGKGNFSGIGGSKATTVTVYGGKLWAENAAFKAIDFGNVTLTKGTGFNGKIEYSSNNSTWSETKDTGAKYVRVGY